MATKERRAVSIERVYQLMDYQIRTDCAHERAEVLIAQEYAREYGAALVRGAKHGKGWSDGPSRGNLRDIERYMKFAATDEGQRLLASLQPVEPATLLPDRLTGALARLEAGDHA